MAKVMIENVTKIYGEGEYAVTALDSASMSVEGGELVAVVGPSGSGKTTLLAITGAFLKPTSGCVRLDDIEVTKLLNKELAGFRLKHIGFVLQSANLVPYLRAIDQLVLLAELDGTNNGEARKRAENLLAELGLEKRFRHYPEQLSGGERQRVAIGRALMNDADVILADEPTANLDSKRGREVVQMLAHEVKSRNKAGIMVTHDERMLEWADRVITICDGKLGEGDCI